MICIHGKNYWEITFIQNWDGAKLACKDGWEPLSVIPMQTGAYDDDPHTVREWHFRRFMQCNTCK